MTRQDMTRQEMINKLEEIRYDTGDFAGCTLFSGAITLREQDGLLERCDKCKQAEVEE